MDIDQLKLFKEVTMSFPTIPAPLTLEFFKRKINSLSPSQREEVLKRLQFIRDLSGPSDEVSKAILENFKNEVKIKESKRLAMPTPFEQFEDKMDMLTIQKLEKIIGEGPLPAVQEPTKKLENKKVLIFTCSFGNGHKITAGAVKSMVENEGASTAIVDLSVGAFRLYDPFYRLGKVFNLCVGGQPLSSVSLFNWILTSKQYWLDHLCHYVDRRYRSVTGTFGKHGIAPAYGQYNNHALKDELRNTIILENPDHIITTYHMDLNIIMEVAREFSIPVLHIPTDFDMKSGEVFDKHDELLDGKLSNIKCTVPTNCKSTLETSQPLPGRILIKDVGIPLRTGFYQTMTPEEKSAYRKRLNIGEEEKVLLMMSGGNGQRMEQPFMLCESDPSIWNTPLRIVIVAGKNQELVQEFRENPKLTRIKDKNNLIFQGRNPNVRIQVLTSGNEQNPYFVDDKQLSKVMDITDAAYSKAGGVSCAELLHKGVKVLLDKTVTPFLWEQFNIKLAQDASLGFVNTSLKAFVEDLKEVITADKPEKNPFHFENVPNTFCDAVRKQIVSKGSKQRNIHKEFYDQLESCIDQNQSVRFCAGEKGIPFLFKEERWFTRFRSQPAVSLEESENILDWMESEISTLKDKGNISTYDSSPYLLHMAVLLRKNLKKNLKLTPESREVYKRIEMKLLKVFVGHSFDNTLLDNNPEFCKFLWKSEWYLLASKWKHQFIEDGDQIRISIPARLDSFPGKFYTTTCTWSQIKEARHLNGDRFVRDDLPLDDEHYMKLNGATITQDGLIIHDRFHGKTLAPMEKKKPSDSFYAEVVTVSRRNYSFWQKGNHSYLRIYDKNGDVYSVGIFGEKKGISFSPLGSFEINGVYNYDQYEARMFADNKWLTSRQKFEITSEDFKTLTDHIVEARKNPPRMSQSAMNCSWFVADTLGKIGIQVSYEERVSALIWKSMPVRVKRIFDSYTNGRLAKVVSTVSQVFSGCLLMALGHYKAKAEREGISYSRLKTIKNIFFNPDSVRVPTPTGLREGMRHFIDSGASEKRLKKELEKIAQRSIFDPILSNLYDMTNSAVSAVSSYSSRVFSLLGIC